MCISVGTDGTVMIIGMDHKVYVLTSSISANPTTWSEIYADENGSLSADYIFVNVKTDYFVGQEGLARLWGSLQ
jgi:hypothetical protein